MSRQSRNLLRVLYSLSLPRSRQGGSRREESTIAESSDTSALSAQIFARLNGCESAFATQPFTDGGDLKHFINDVISDIGTTNLDVVVAWVKRSGLSRLYDDLESLRQRPGETRLIVGIDEGGATRQRLELARSLFDHVYVFHDRSGRTFHPKLYAAWGEGVGLVLSGSHNATAGGVYFDYQAGIECSLDLPDDVDFLNSIHRYVDRLIGDIDVCKELTDEVLKELATNPRYKVGDEDARRPGARKRITRECRQRS